MLENEFQRAVSSVAERFVRNEETRVRFAARPPALWADSSTVEHLNGIEEMAVQFRPCPPNFKGR